MEKKKYFIPLTEVILYETELMYLTGEASAPPDPTSSTQSAPERRVEVF